jgi:hypothetical protein
MVDSIPHRLYDPSGRGIGTPAAGGFARYRHLADIGTATGYASDAGLDLSPLLTALASPGAITRGTAAYTTAQSCLADAQSSLGHSIGAAEATLSGTNVTNAGSADAGVAGLLAATDASGQLSSLVSAGAYVRRTATNLANAST